MQGRKDFTPKLFYELSLDRLIPKDDFYRKANEYLDLHFLYKSTEQYYSTEGQQSIDPVGRGACRCGLQQWREFAIL